jgi:hypothetical protein
LRLLLLAVTSLLAHGATAASPPVLRLTGPVKELAADGGRVAVLVQTSRPNCTQSRVAVWQPSTRSLAPIGVSPCSESVSTGAGIYSVALAGRRVAYVLYAGGNTRELQLETATLPQRKPVTVASAAFGLDEGSGTYIGRVAGDGSLLAFDWWTACPMCAGSSRPVPDSSTILRLGSTGSACPDAGLGTLRRCTTILSQPGTVRLHSVAGGSVAVADPNGTLRVLSPSGIVRTTIPPKAGDLRALRLDSDGRTLVTLVQDIGNQNGLRVYDASGALSASYRLPATRSSGEATCGDPQGCKTAALRLEDVQSGIAVCVLGTQIGLVRLSDGKRATIRVPGRTPVHAQLEPDGLYYSYSLTARSSRVAFLPFSGIARRFP